jgi:general secretion pathway protein J
VNRQRGFSLLEVLLATSLLALGIALAFSAFRGATQATEHASLMADRGERLRAVQGFMRRQIDGALPFPFREEGATRTLIVFESDRSHIELVAPMPGYMSRGGPYVQRFNLVRGDNGLRLEFEHQLLTPDGPIDAERPPEVLLDGIAEGQFEVRSIDDRGEPTGWESKDEAREILPELVRLRLRMIDPHASFPDLIAAPRMAASAATARPQIDADVGGREE